MLPLKSLLFLLAFLIDLYSSAQKPVHIFWKDNEELLKKFHDQTLIKKDQYIAAAGKEYEEDYKKIYDNHFTGIGQFWESTRVVTSAAQHEYLQSIVKKIIDGNPELKGFDARIVFTRDEWPNAVSMGDGTIGINGGLILYLNNESELVFTICHEISHYFLDHSRKTIKKSIETYNSEEFKNEIRRLSKQEYKVGHQLEDLLKKMTFGSRRHGREHEAEADLQAFKFMKNTAYDCNSIRSCLEIFNRVDDTMLLQPFIPEKSFDFEGYPFKKKWIEKTSSIFAQMNNDDSPLTPQEKDSLRTHPDCNMRIQMLEDSIHKTTGGQKFLVSESFFNQLKKDFLAEITQELYEQDNLARNLYYSLVLLQNKQHMPLAVYSVVRDFNILYEKQKNHKLGDIDKEGRTYSSDYNLLLRMIDRLRLEEIAYINYFFCKQHEQLMEGYDAFHEEMDKATKIMLQY